MDPWLRIVEGVVRAASPPTSPGLCVPLELCVVAQELEKRLLLESQSSLMSVSEVWAEGPLKF